MRPKKSLIATLAICALAVPASTATVLTLTTSPAFAKAGGNGKGGGGNHGNSRKGNSRSNKPARTRSNGNGPTNANRGNAPVVSAAATGAPEVAGMSPNQLGSMNGALHANINAVLAHIRNGNTSGPIGALAGLAAADFNAVDAQDVLDLAAQFDALTSALEAAGFDTLDDYLAAIEAGDADADPAIDDAVAALGDAIDGEMPSEEDIADAEAALEAQQAAEDGILDAWNKSGEASDEEQAELLQALRDRLDAESEAIATTMEEIDLASATEEVVEEDLVAE